MRYELTALSASSTLARFSNPDGPLEILPKTFENATAIIDGPLFADPILSLTSDELAPVRQRTTTVVDPEMNVYAARDVLIVGDNHLVLEKSVLVYSGFNGDDIRQPSFEYHDCLSRGTNDHYHLEIDERKLERLSGRYILGMWQPGRMYHHWMFECLSRLVATRTNPSFKDVKILIPMDAPRFVLETLDILQVDRSELAFYNPKHVIEIDELLLVPAPRFDLEQCGVRALKAIRHQALPNLPHSPFKGQRVLFTRRDAPTGERILLNEDRFVERLQQEGFVAIEPSNYSVAAQLSIAHHADLIACIHGSAGANLLFGSESTKVLHIFPDCVHYFYAHGIATALAGSRYGYIYGPSFQRTIRDHNNPWLIDSERVMDCVTKLDAST